jgi:hypothetical protein
VDIPTNYQPGWTKTYFYSGIPSISRDWLVDGPNLSTSGVDPDALCQAHGYSYAPGPCKGYSLETTAVSGGQNGTDSTNDYSYGQTETVLNVILRGTLSYYDFSQLTAQFGTNYLPPGPRIMCNGPGSMVPIQVFCVK